MAMPSKFTDVVRDRIVLALDAGSFMTTAAMFAGISRYTLRDWMASTDPRYELFQQRVMEARGRAGLAKSAEVFEKDPKFWLLCGPCRETYNDDGSVAEEGWAKPGPRRVVACKECAARKQAEREIGFDDFTSALSGVGVRLSDEQRLALAKQLERIREQKAAPQSRGPEAGDSTFSTFCGAKGDSDAAMPVAALVSNTPAAPSPPDAGVNAGEQVGAVQGAGGVSAVGARSSVVTKPLQAPGHGIQHKDGMGEKPKRPLTRDLLNDTMNDAQWLRIV